MAENNGIYLNVGWSSENLESAKTGYSSWEYEPYRISKGGVITTPLEFYTNADAKKYFKRKTRYYMSRWAYSPFVMNWETMNEYDFAMGSEGWKNNSSWQSVIPWYSDIGSYVKNQDPYNHLLSGSTGTSSWNLITRPTDYQYWRDFWNLPVWDVIHAHNYEGYPTDTLGNINCQFDTLVDTVSSTCNDPIYYPPSQKVMPSHYGLPLMIGEWATDTGTANFTTNNLHDAIWMATINGGSILPWFYDYASSNNMIPVFKGLSAFMQGENLGGKNMKRIRFPTTDKAQLQAYGLANGSSILGWVVNTGTSTNGNITFPNMQNGSYNVEIWDAWNGTKLSTSFQTAVSGSLSIPVTNITHSLAFKANLTSITPTPTPPACIPSCTGKACGDDLCGGSCGSCSINYSCINFQCIAPTPTPTSTSTPIPSTPTKTSTPTPTRTPTPTTTPIPTGGNTYYVSTTGNDANSGTQTSPWRTIQKAANTVVAGDTVNVADGIQETNRVTINKSGTEQAPIIFEASGGVSAATTKGFTLGSSSPISYVTLKGFRVINAIGKGMEIMCKNCVIENNYVEYASDGGILIKPLATMVNSTIVVDYESSSQIVVKNNRLYHNAQFGIDVRGRNHLVEGNEIWRTIQHHPNRVPSPAWADADGMHFHGSGHIFRNNYIHDIPFDGVEVVDSHTDCFQTYQILPYQEAASSITFDGNKCIIPYYAATNAHTNAFMLAQATNLTIKNNLIHAYGGINTGGGGNSNLNILNNTWIGLTDQTQLKNCAVGTVCWPGGIGLQNTPNAVIKNNIFYDHLYAPVTVDSASIPTLVHNNNLMYRSDGLNWNASQLISSVGELWKINPQFIDPSVNNYYLQSSSPAINTGYNLGSLVVNDLDGITRPQGAGYDIGAYEYSGVACIPNCTGKACGDDECGSTCGSCSINYSCINYQCIAPTPTRTPTPIPPTSTPIPPTSTPTPVPPTSTPTRTPTPVPPTPTRTPTPIPPTPTQIPISTNTPIPTIPICIPNCVSKACGDDGCGSSCGSCAINESCLNFQCVAPIPTETLTPTVIPTIPVCTPNCTGKACGDDGCGSSCGSCQVFEVCKNNYTCGVGEVPSNIPTAIPTPTYTIMPTPTFHIVFSKKTKSLSKPTDKPKKIKQEDSQSEYSCQQGCTLSTWINFQSKEINKPIIMGKYNQTPIKSEYFLTYNKEKDLIEFYVFSENEESYVSALDFGSPPINTWIFIVAWYDASEQIINIQVNNGQVNSQYWRKPLNITLSPFVVSGQNFQGLISKPNFQKTLLNTEERSIMYNKYVGLYKNMKSMNNIFFTISNYFKKLFKFINLK